ncbi:hypothetical protein F5Y15DRAFT_415243 [Xylariaceae sp. FL0016]|nr:hypothetical protein F5Y15DRAFT_415243 [Xylariaceae sp. FL0016]
MASRLGYTYEVSAAIAGRKKNPDKHDKSRIRKLVRRIRERLYRPKQSVTAAGTADDARPSVVSEAPAEASTNGRTSRASTQVVGDDSRAPSSQEEFLPDRDTAQTKAKPVRLAIFRLFGKQRVEINQPIERTPYVPRHAAADFARNSIPDVPAERRYALYLEPAASDMATAPERSPLPEMRRHSRVSMQDSSPAVPLSPERVSQNLTEFEDISALISATMDSIVEPGSGGEIERTRRILESEDRPGSLIGPAPCGPMGSTDQRRRSCSGTDPHTRSMQTSEFQEFFHRAIDTDPALREKIWRSTMTGFGSRAGLVIPPELNPRAARLATSRGSRSARCRGRRQSWAGTLDLDEFVYVHASRHSLCLYAGAGAGDGDGSGNHRSSNPRERHSLATHQPHGVSTFDFDHERGGWGRGRSDSLASRRYTSSIRESWGSLASECPVRGVAQTVSAAKAEQVTIRPSGQNRNHYDSPARDAWQGQSWASQPLPRAMGAVAARKRGSSGSHTLSGYFTPDMPLTTDRKAQSTTIIPPERLATLDKIFSQVAMYLNFDMATQQHHVRQILASDFVKPFWDEYRRDYLEPADEIEDIPCDDLYRHLIASNAFKQARFVAGETSGSDASSSQQQMPDKRGWHALDHAARFVVRVLRCSWKHGGEWARGKFDPFDDPDGESDLEFCQVWGILWYQQAEWEAANMDSWDEGMGETFVQMMGSRL